MSKIIQQFDRWFLQPHPRLMNPEKIQRSRLLAAILLVLILTTGLILAIVISHDPEDINEPTVRGGFVLMGISLLLYIVSKLGATSVPVMAFILLITALFIYIPFYSGESPIFLAFLMVPIIMTAIFFSIRWTAFVSFGILLVSAILLSFIDRSTQASSYWDLRNMLFSLALAAGLILTFIWHIGTLENIRQQELIRINQELEYVVKLRTQAEHAYRESEERYRNAITAAGLVPYLVDYREKRFTFIGEDIYKLTGYTAQEIQPKILRERIQE